MNRGRIESFSARYAERTGPLLLATTKARAVVWVVAGALAAVSVGVTIGGIAKRSAPQVALGVWPANGFAAANAALARVRMEATAPATELGTARNLALEGLASEPLAARAAAVLGLVDERQGDGVAAAVDMNAAARLSRRDEIANAWLVTDASRRGDLAGTIRAIDRAILTDPSTSKLYVPALGKALEDSRTIPVFTTIMRQRPVWALDFWREVTVSQRALRNAGEVRALLRLTGMDERSITVPLLQALASARHFDTAERLYQSALGRPGGDLVRNGDFRRQPGLPVFDWDLPASGEYSAAIDANAGEMSVTALPGNGGTVARQLVRVDPGRYRLSVVLARPLATADTSVSVRLRCAIGDAEIAALNVASGQTAVDFTQAQPCRYAWLTVDAVPRADGAAGEHDMALRRIALTRRS